MKRYLVVSIRHPDFDPSVIAPHLAFLDELRAAGQLQLSGGFADKSGGAYLLGNIDSLEQARHRRARSAGHRRCFHPDRPRMGGALSRSP